MQLNIMYVRNEGTSELPIWRWYANSWRQTWIWLVYKDCGPVEFDDWTWKRVPEPESLSGYEPLWEAEKAYPHLQVPPKPDPTNQYLTFEERMQLRSQPNTQFQYTPTCQSVSTPTCQSVSSQPNCPITQSISQQVLPSQSQIMEPSQPNSAITQHALSSQPHVTVLSQPNTSYQCSQQQMPSQPKTHVVHKPQSIVLSQPNDPSKYTTSIPSRSFQPNSQSNQTPVSIKQSTTFQQSVPSREPTESSEQRSHAPQSRNSIQFNSTALSIDSDTPSTLLPSCQNKPMQPPPGITRLKSPPPGFNRLTPPPPGFVPKTIAEPCSTSNLHSQSNTGVQSQLSPDDIVTPNRYKSLLCLTPPGLVNSDKHESGLPTHSPNVKSTTDSVSPPPGFSPQLAAQSQGELIRPDSSDGHPASRPMPCCTPPVLSISAETSSSSGSPPGLVKTGSRLSTAKSAVTPLLVNTQIGPPSYEPVSTSNISKATPSPLQPRSRHTKKAHLWSHPSPKHPHEQEPLSKSPTHVSSHPQNTRSVSPQAVVPKKKVEVESCVVDLATLVLSLLFVVWTFATALHGMLMSVAQQGSVTFSLCSLYRHCGALLRGSGEQTPD